MRPDLDDFDDLNASTEDAPRARAMSWLVLGVAIVGFAALAYYAYESGTQSVGEGGMMMVEAEGGAIKETPADAGGEEFPHQEKTIYDALSPYRTDDAPKVEKLLPETEEPVIPEPAVGQEKEAAVTLSGKEEATTYVNKEITDGEAKAEAAAEPKKAEAAPTDEVKAAPLEEVKPAPKEEVKPAPKKEESKPAPAPTPAAKGSYKIQLGAFSSMSEANQQWSKISAKHGDVITGSHAVEQAEVKGKTWYRLRVTGYASEADAKAACAKLSGRGQACIPAK